MISSTTEFMPFTRPHIGKGKSMLKSVQKLALASLICSSFVVSPIAFSADETMDEPATEAAAPAAPAAMPEPESAPAPAEMSAAAKEFAKLDSNKDGSIDKKEAKKNKKLSKSYKKLAKNGKLDEPTFTKWFEKKTVAKAKK